jgi:dTDP-4-dehydrorhamnose reductase
MLKLAAEREQLNIVNDQFGAPTSAITVADITAQIIAQINSAKEASSAQNWWTAHQGHTTW